jgi:sortase A
MMVIERALLVIGLACLGWYGLAAADAAYSERQARAAVERRLAAAEVDRAVSSAELQTPAPAPALALADDGEAGDRSAEPLPAPEPVRKVEPERAREALTFAANVVGLLEIPRLGFSTPILEGDDTETLRGAAGHLPDTPQPWEEGNSAIAAHRDGIFRPLRNVRVGDELRVQTPHGEVRYKVSDTHIVVPTDLSVLEAKTPHMLTLITCYPFNYVGAAPKRFIVHAERVVE